MDIIAYLSGSASSIVENAFMFLGDAIVFLFGIIIACAGMLIVAGALIGELRGLRRLGYLFTGIITFVIGALLIVG